MHPAADNPEPEMRGHRRLTHLRQSQCQRRAGRRPAGSRQTRWADFLGEPVISGGAPIVVFVRGRDASREPEEVHRAVLIEDNKRAAHRALEDRILNGEGRASPEQCQRHLKSDPLAAPEF